MIMFIEYSTQIHLKKVTEIRMQEVHFQRHLMCINPAVFIFMRTKKVMLTKLNSVSPAQDINIFYMPGLFRMRAITTLLTSFSWILIKIFNFTYDWGGPYFILIRLSTKDGFCQKTKIECSDFKSILRTVVAHYTFEICT